MKKTLLAILVMATLGAVPAGAQEATRRSGLHIDPVFHFDLFQAAGVEFSESARREMVGEASSFGGLMVGNRANLLRWGRLEILGVGWGIVVRDRPTVYDPENQAVELAGTATLVDLRLAKLSTDLDTSLYLTASYFWGMGGARGWLVGLSFGSNP